MMGIDVYIIYFYIANQINIASVNSENVKEEKKGFLKKAFSKDEPVKEADKENRKESEKRNK